MFRYIFTIHNIYIICKHCHLYTRNIYLFKYLKCFRKRIWILMQIYFWRKVFKYLQTVVDSAIKIRGDTHMTSTLREGRGWEVRQTWDDIGRRGWGVSEYSGRPIFIFFIKENWFCAMARHHANKILLARNLPFDSDVRQWSHPLMIPLNCLWFKSNV